MSAQTLLDLQTTLLCLAVLVAVGGALALLPWSRTEVRQLEAWVRRSREALTGWAAPGRSGWASFPRPTAGWQPQPAVQWSQRAGSDPACAAQNAASVSSPEHMAWK